MIHHLMYLPMRKYLIRQNQWTVFSDEIPNKLKQNPMTLYAAIKSFLTNKEKYSKIENSLIYGLFTAFKYHRKFTSSQVQSVQGKPREQTLFLF